METNGRFGRKWTSRVQNVFESESSEAERDINCLTKTASNQTQNQCCNCCTSCTEIQESQKHSLRRKSSNGISNEGEQISSNHCSSYKEQLETRILSEEMNEQLSYDSHNCSKKQIQDLSTLIRSFSAYVRSLDIRARSAERLEQVLSEFSPKHRTLLSKRTDSTLISVRSKIKSILSLCYKEIELPTNYYDSCNEYSEKYKELAEATDNFYYLLQKEEMSHFEMRKLDQDYEKIKEEFNESKTSVSCQLNIVIHQKSDVLQRCVQGLLPLLEDMMEQDREIYNILQGIVAKNGSSSSGNKSLPHELHKSSKSSRRSSNLTLSGSNSWNCCCVDDQEYRYTM